MVAAELSRTEVGVVEARVAMPFLADDRYTMFLRVAGADVPTSIIRVSPIGLSLAALQNASSYTDNQVIFGGVITLYGSGMGPDELVSFRLDASGRIQKALAGTEILFDGIPAPLLYVSGSQLSAIAPFALEGKNSTGIVVSLNGRASVPLTVPVLANDPGLFTINRSAAGQGAILNQNDSSNSTQNPAQPNQIVVLYGSGFGASSFGTRYRSGLLAFPPLSSMRGRHPAQWRALSDQCAHPIQRAQRGTRRGGEGGGE